ncbi:MAG: type II secretion system major pseudopilin GspG [Deltaproteobacteria bacterium]|mgnify:CR=1 FL=1|nr:type II secretion system major pseudopilin GspG [Deltaproteobacteria bacterium]MBT4089423.1 type II secretion system major pseudopilin GspG [Deltaproteobacteria bacterium]MBT4269261.1 type II secretion system major pseudopilin GspG [Deltaproteobacteria bacterium]MBT4639224.1 type II secretion system major pseudopilin GspG [Deltaproteobacteria bacterium]MBT6611709.1 type II secretion system major pseudopilin GspG [Deltaproteobacteria bacterium]
MKTKIFCARETDAVCKTEQDGFSFIEIMIVIVIMAGMIAIVGPMLFGKLDEAKVDQARIQMKSLVGALDLYHLDNSAYPSTEQGMDALLKQPVVGSIPKNWRGPYLRSTKIPKDPWENDYVYQSEGKSIALKSLGADGVEGGDGINADIPLE